MTSPMKLVDFRDPAVETDMYSFAKELWPICRSLTGDGVRQTLSLIQCRLPGLKVHEVPSGTRCFDWEVPDEWNISDAYLLGPTGKKIVDFQKNNLHVMGYSEPVDLDLTLDELKPHLFFLKDQPDAIPYVTSYYRRNWGFCLTYNEFRKLKKGRYKAVIRSTLKKGHLTYADLVIPGETTDEILFSTYVCHPSLANNEISGPVVTTALAQWILSLPKRRYTYRFYYGPETIGAIVYLSKHLDHLKSSVKAGYVLTCVGDNRSYSFIPSRKGNTLADRLTQHVLKTLLGKFRFYSFLERGSDERQFCSPGVDLPVVSAMRTPYGKYPEYHTSLDDLSVISAKGLGGALAVYKACSIALEANQIYKLAQPCEPQLGKRNLYPHSSIRGNYPETRSLLNFLAYCDGETDLVNIAETIGLDVFTVMDMAKKLEAAGVIATR